MKKFCWKKYDLQIGIFEYLDFFFLFAFIGVTVRITLDYWY